MENGPVVALSSPRMYRLLLDNICFVNVTMGTTAFMRRKSDV